LATADNIRDGLQWLQTETTSQDIAMLYIAGYGINDNTGNFFFMPVNADINNSATCVSYAEIKHAISSVAGKLLVFMEASHSGNVLGNNQQRAELINQAVYKLTGANGPVIFTSSTGRQVSLEAPEWNNGAFTKALVEGLTGKAADLNDRKMITVKSLDYYIANRMKELTSGRQATTTIIPRGFLPDFPIAVVTD
jgi:uncharacterized caspase-like protein